jgi:hypothetical protein
VPPAARAIETNGALRTNEVINFTQRVLKLRSLKFITFLLPLVLPCGGLGYDGSIAYPRFDRKRVPPSENLWFPKFQRNFEALPANWYPSTGQNPLGIQTLRVRKRSFQNL